MFRISLLPIGTVDGKEVVSVSWQVATDPELNNLKVDLQESEYINSITVNLPIDDGSVYYFRRKLHYDDGSDSGWSRIGVITKDSKNFVFTNTIVNTPKIEVETPGDNASLGGFYINTSDFSLFTGVGNHMLTEYVIEDSEGNTVWNYKTKTYLTRVRVPIDILRPNRVYLVKARHLSTTGVYSNFGKYVIKTTSVELNTVDVTGVLTTILQTLGTIDTYETTAIDLANNAIVVEDTEQEY